MITNSPTDSSPTSTPFTICLCTVSIKRGNVPHSSSLGWSLVPKQVNERCQSNIMPVQGQASLGLAGFACSLGPQLLPWVHTCANLLEDEKLMAQSSPSQTSQQLINHSAREQGHPRPANSQPTTQHVGKSIPDQPTANELPSICARPSQSSQQPTTHPACGQGHPRLSGLQLTHL